MRWVEEALGNRGSGEYRLGERTAVIGLLRVREVMGDVE